MDNEKRDQLLWDMAKKRAGFKWSLFSYLIVNSFLVVLWYISTGAGSYFWPVWPMLGWGLGLAFQYFHAYHGNAVFSAEDEYEKLIQQQNKQ